MKTNNQSLLITTRDTFRKHWLYYSTASGTLFWSPITCNSGSQQGSVKACFVCGFGQAQENISDHLGGWEQSNPSPHWWRTATQKVNSKAWHMSYFLTFKALIIIIIIIKPECLGWMCWEGVRHWIFWTWNLQMCWCTGCGCVSQRSVKKHSSLLVWASGRMTVQHSVLFTYWDEENWRKSRAEGRKINSSILGMLSLKLLSELQVEMSSRQEEIQVWSQTTGIVLELVQHGQHLNHEVTAMKKTQQWRWKRKPRQGRREGNGPGAGKVMNHVKWCCDVR